MVSALMSSFQGGVVPQKLVPAAAGPHVQHVLSAGAVDVQRHIHRSAGHGPGTDFDGGCAYHAPDACIPAAGSASPPVPRSPSWLLAVAGAVPQRGHLGSRDEAGPQQTILVQLGDPLAIPQVSFAAGHVAHVRGVAHAHHDPLAGQRVIHRPPVHPADSIATWLTPNSVSHAAIFCSCRQNVANRRTVTARPPG
jgi:hypothetical protein